MDQSRGLVLGQTQVDPAELSWSEPDPAGVRSVQRSWCQSRSVFKPHVHEVSDQSREASAPLSVTETPESSQLVPCSERSARV